MTPLESANRHPAPSQKPPTSKQSTSPAVPTSAPPLSSASIAPNPLFLNLLPINPPSQTGDSKLVANKTNDSSHKEKAPQQKARRHALTSPPLVASDEMMPLEPANLHPCTIAEATDVETADPACSARFGNPSFVCFDCSQPSIFESASHQPTLTNRRFKVSCQQDN